MLNRQSFHNNTTGVSLCLYSQFTLHVMCVCCTVWLLSLNKCSTFQGVRWLVIWNLQCTDTHQLSSPKCQSGVPGISALEPWFFCTHLHTETVVEGWRSTCQALCRDIVPGLILLKIKVILVLQWRHLKQWGEWQR